MTSTRASALIGLGLIAELLGCSRAPTPRQPLAAGTGGSQQAGNAGSLPASGTGGASGSSSAGGSTATLEPDASVTMLDASADDAGGPTVTAPAPAVDVTATSARVIAFRHSREICWIDAAGDMRCATPGSAGTPYARVAQRGPFTTLALDNEYPGGHGCALRRDGTITCFDVPSAIMGLCEQATSCAGGGVPPKLSGTIDGTPWRSPVYATSHVLVADDGSYVRYTPLAPSNDMDLAWALIVGGARSPFPGAVLCVGSGTVRSNGSLLLQDLSRLDCSATATGTLTGCVR